MPYKIEKRGSKYCVIKESDGTSMGCHDTESEAEDQQRALYANEEKAAGKAFSIIEEVELIIKRA